MTWARNVAHPSELLKKGQPIETVILHVDKENKRISLGLKQLQRDPWEDVTRKFPVGANVKGKVVRLTEFGRVRGARAGGRRPAPRLPDVGPTGGAARRTSCSSATS